MIEIPDGDKEYDDGIESMNNQQEVGNIIGDKIAKEMWVDNIRERNWDA